MSKSTKQLMAEYIRNEDCDSCVVCAYYKDCNAKMVEAEEQGIEYCPPEQDCINGIINYFEHEAFNAKQK